MSSYQLRREQPQKDIRDIHKSTIKLYLNFLIDVCVSQVHMDWECHDKLVTEKDTRKLKDQAPIKGNIGWNNI